MIWDRSTSDDIAAADKRRVVILPLAATEQHGPHLPLATDRLISDAICTALDAAIAGKILILPCLPVGYSAHHRSFPGTLTIGHQQLIDTAGEMARCVLADGFHNLLILNSHGGNIALGNVLLEKLGGEFPHARIAFTSWWQAASEALRAITETEAGGTGHACEFETSLMLHLHPELVIRENIAPGTNRATFTWAEADMLHGCAARLHRDFSSMTTNGVYGDPTAATAEKGERILQAVVASLGAICGSLHDS